ncbi:cryptochrome/photolyase family protein [Pseudomonas oryzihabitans]|uniref:Cryptochrome/photolyase family protein n=1 Tax=Pseudomonas oryzihabitans TaxID=47885 RepID=A0ABX3IW96_9PSED|nr:cryptochrome/photolyase family protein [Pseudomonas psychrotolerans]ONN72166.1 cryptochrome/photolyase family protein [Pseudomonas psychrotolerans]
MSEGAVRRLLPVFGDQLSPRLASLRDADSAQDVLLLAEVMSEASYVPHHPRKIALIFSAMRHFASEMRARGFRVLYRTLDDPDNQGSLPAEIAFWAKTTGAREIRLTETGEWRLEQALRALDLAIPVRWHGDDRFLCSRAAFARWAGSRTELRMEAFYRGMRRRHGWLMAGPDEPCGGVWNLDKDNRKALPKDQPVPEPFSCPPDACTRDVLELVGQRFAHHYGRLEGFDYPVTRADAERLWQHFLGTGLRDFGSYQDAMARGEPYLHHARISAALNIGLLDLRQLCADVDAAYREGRVPLNSAEGFLRQLIGWREYVHGVYWLRMPEYRELNALGNTRALPEFYWTGSTRMACMREAIGQTLALGYAHHIQRLMVTGNFALLAGIAPQAIGEWYLAVYLDAFEWVELPNTQAMVMHADGGYLASKPYCASGQYIRRQSDYCKDCHYQVTEALGDRACPFNALYWHFLIRHRERFAHYPRMLNLYRNLDRQAPERQQALWQRGEALLARLDAGESL